MGLPSHMREPLWHALKADEGHAVVSYDFFTEKMKSKICKVKGLSTSPPPNICF